MGCGGLAKPKSDVHCTVLTWDASIKSDPAGLMPWINGSLMLPVHRGATFDVGMRWTHLLRTRTGRLGCLVPQAEGVAAVEQVDQPGKILRRYDAGTVDIAAIHAMNRRA